MKTVQLVELALTGLRLGYQKCGTLLVAAAVDTLVPTNIITL